LTQISRWAGSGASAILIFASGALALAACGGRPGPEDRVDPAEAALGTMPLDSVWQIETTGSPPGDTTVAFPAGRSRVVLVRHGPPENVVFAEVRFDSASFPGAGGTPVTVTIRPRPGTYGLALETSAPLGRAEVTFRYAVHFQAPSGALAKYGSDIGVERALGIGRLEDGVVTFLPTLRPAIDNLQAVIPSAGTYLVGAPR
jgi:hypothetical protein